MNKFIRDIFTERNGDYDPVRLLSIIGFFNYLFLASYEMIYHCKDFDLTDFSTGISVILGVIAGGVTLKYKNEAPANQYHNQDQNIDNK